MKEFIFYIIIFLTNIIQGITGFAGTILAMSPSMILVGYDVAKPILNVLGIEYEAFICFLWNFCFAFSISRVSFKKSPVIKKGKWRDR